MSNNILAGSVYLIKSALPNDPGHSVIKSVFELGKLVFASEKRGNAGIKQRFTSDSLKLEEVKRSLEYITKASRMHGLSQSLEVLNQFSHIHH
jgi:hypothetical protein